MKVKTVSIPQAVGTVATHMKRLQLLVLSHVSIPQAVGTVATKSARGSNYVIPMVSIPQAVGTVATFNKVVATNCNDSVCFNTASGRYCCNW